MSGRIVSLEVAVHNAIQEQLPIYLSGHLDAAASAQLQQHLQTCALCQEELEWQRMLRSASPPVDDGLDVERAFASLASRLETPPAPAQAAWWRRMAANEPRWLRWALAAQCAVIAGLALLLARPGPQRYDLLGAAGQQQGNLVVAFQPGTRESDMRSILLGNGARIVGGPTEADAYLLAVPGNQRDEVLRRLRTESSIRLAEPLAGSDKGGPP